MIFSLKGLKSVLRSSQLLLLRYRVLQRLPKIGREWGQTYSKRALIELAVSCGTQTKLKRHTAKSLAPEKVSQSKLLLAWGL